MEFTKEEFMGKVGRLEALLERDFSTLSGSLRKTHASAPISHSKQRLIEQLQYHDIIRQKIQHVGQFGPLLEEEFAGFTAGRPTTTAAVLPGLLELSMALLQFARLEYDEIREEIQLQLLALPSSPNPAGEAVYRQFQQEVQELIKSLGRLYLLTDPSGPEADGELSSEKLRKICQSFSMQSEREIFRSLFEEDLTPELPAEKGEDSTNIELF
ncbi:hypothetical protein [Cesiribacter andamanensis]|uniref:Uncharacterized protein n=1 Tax=Cesiribacter andamanensis AMV16 TaxID=1279009 RepID=M7N9M9_9BACT|nr:hypothetical protein [Cesiribacter andamanensis]EMR03977.1 hypothetical protein ADICEAN_00848 [Cesiribacter andamanensis AMV16]